MFCLAELKTKAALALCQLAQALNCDQKVLVTTEKSAARISVWWPSDSSPGGEAGRWEAWGGCRACHVSRPPHSDVKELRQARHFGSLCLCFLVCKLDALG